jgi:hypothetical protein
MFSFFVKQKRDKMGDIYNIDEKYSSFSLETILILTYVIKNKYSKSVDNSKAPNLEFLLRRYSVGDTVPLNHLIKKEKEIIGEDIAYCLYKSAKIGFYFALTFDEQRKYGDVIKIMDHFIIKPLSTYVLMINSQNIRLREKYFKKILKCLETIRDIVEPLYAVVHLDHGFIADLESVIEINSY